MVLSEGAILCYRYAVMQRYHGALNFREHLSSTITPCGSFVIAGSEDAAAYMWNTETGMAIFHLLSLNRIGSEIIFLVFLNFTCFTNEYLIKQN